MSARIPLIFSVPSTAQVACSVVAFGAAVVVSEPKTLLTIMLCLAGVLPLVCKPLLEPMLQSKQRDVDQPKSRHPG
jgi:hypothetical protein